jgi:hypothetical protein
VGTGAQSVTVTFLNHRSDGRPAKDRNLYVEAITWRGAPVANATAALLGAGPVSFPLP